MESIEQMIKRLCPEGVKYVKLGEVCEILDSQRKPVSKAKRVAGEYPYYGANGIQDYIDNYIFDGTFILLGEDGSVINKDNSPVLNWATGKIWVNNHAHILVEKQGVAKLRYLYFVLQKVDVSPIVRGVPPKLNQKNLREIEIPLPPMEVQERIVEVLDKMTALTAELQAELEARKQQYEYYRNQLLTHFAPDEPVREYSLGELGTISTGTHNTKDGLQEGLYPFYTRGIDVLRLNSYDYDETAVITAGDGAGVGKVIHFAKGKFALHQRAYKIVVDETKILSKYLYYYMNATFYNYIMKSSFSSSVTSIRKPMLFDYPIPVPSLEEQERIVSILDKFEVLVNDLSQGLPAEIEARRQQYEHYRNRLLTFERR